MSPTTAAALAEIREEIAAGASRLIPAFMSRTHGRAAVSAAFKMAKAQGLIEVAYVSAGSTVYKPAERAAANAALLAAALIERAASTVH